MGTRLLQHPVGCLLQFPQVLCQERLGRLGRIQLPHHAVQLLHNGIAHLELQILVLLGVRIGHHVKADQILLQRLAVPEEPRPPGERSRCQYQNPQPSPKPRHKKSPSIRNFSQYGR